MTSPNDSRIALVGGVDVQTDGAQIDKWPVQLYPTGHGRWAFIAGPYSGGGFTSKKAAQEFGERARAKALARTETQP